MKLLLSLAIAFFMSFTALADIPRMDIMVFSYDGHTYYTPVFMQGLVIRHDSVLDYRLNYLGSKADLVHLYFQDRPIKAYRDLLRIPRHKVGQKMHPEEQAYYSGDILVLVGAHRNFTTDDMPELAFEKIIVGYAAGEITSPTLSMSDQTWILDYPLERIAVLDDKELCNIELFAIKGNVSKVEAFNIKAELLEYYDSIFSEEPIVTKRTADEIYSELLKRNILMIGFCSC